MKNTFLLLVSGIMLASSAIAQPRDTEADALRHRQLENTPIYGELYQSLAFDGGWNSACPGQTFRFKGKNDRIYAAWVDYFGDVIVGYHDNATGASSMYPVIDNRKLKTENTLLSLSYVSDGSLVLCVANKGSQDVSVFVSKPEDINSWKETPFRHDAKIELLSGCNTGARSSLALLGGGKVTLLENMNGVLKESDEMKATGNSELFKLLTKGGKLYLATNNTLYSCEGGFKSVAALGSNQTLADFIPTESGFMAVAKSAKGLTVSEISNGKIKAYEVKCDSICGDIVIDPDNAKRIYFTKQVNGISEIFKAVNARGSRWTVEAVTENSPFNNKSIIAVSNTTDDVPVQIMWLQESINDVKINALSSVKMDIFQPQITDITSAEQIKILMKKVADWQLGRSYSDKAKSDWQWGAFYTGLMAAHNRLQSPYYWNEMMNVGQYYDWAILPDMLHADRLLVSDMYLYLYENSGKKNHYMIKPTKYAMDLHTSRKAKIEPQYEKGNYRTEWWSWCDALYMAPISFYSYSRITGKTAAMDFAYKQWKVSEDYLYSEADSLFFRDDRYFTKQSTNGKKVFWARGNGWVFGSLPRIMNSLPEGHEYRKHYEQLYKQMASKIKSIQMKDGLWTCSLYDPEELNIGESSGSGFFGFALAWGINNGLLDKNEYMDVVMKAWAGMTGNVTSFGKLGYVQQIAGDPYPFFYHQYHTYASGAFLLFADEMITLFENTK